MPPLVKACYKSVLKHKGCHNVVFIMMKNVKKNVDIPEPIYHLVSEGKILIKYLSDVVREHILYQQCGI